MSSGVIELKSINLCKFNVNVAESTWSSRALEDVRIFGGFSLGGCWVFNVDVDYSCKFHELGGPNCDSGLPSLDIDLERGERGAIGFLGYHHWTESWVSGLSSSAINLERGKRWTSDVDLKERKRERKGYVGFHSHRHPYLWVILGKILTTMSTIVIEFLVLGKPQNYVSERLLFLFW